jgi:hypothetical protein
MNHSNDKLRVLRSKYLIKCSDPVTGYSLIADIVGLGQKTAFTSSKADFQPRIVPLAGTFLWATGGWRRSNFCSCCRRVTTLKTLLTLCSPSYCPHFTFGYTVDCIHCFSLDFFTLIHLIRPLATMPHNSVLFTC